MTKDINPEDVATAVNILRQFYSPKFPSGDAALEIVQRFIESMVTTKEQLYWLIEAACHSMKFFSLPELREIFCSRFAPADGKYLTAEDGERAYHEREAAEYDRKLIEWKRSALLLGQPEPPPFDIPPEAVKLIAPPARHHIAEPRRVIADLERQLKDQVESGSRRSSEETARIVAELEAKIKRNIQ